MNDEQAVRLLNRLADQVSVGPAPVREVLRAGSRVRRRRRRVALCAAVALLLAPVGVAGLAQFPDKAKQTAMPATRSLEPQAPAGMRLVGMGRLAVAVPEDWGTNDVRCGQPLRDTVHFASEAVRACGVRSRFVSYLRITGTASGAGSRVEKRTERDAVINDVPVRLGSIVCER